MAPFLHIEQDQALLSGKPIVLVAPLDWGLGHATRSIPVVQGLLDQGCMPLLAADRGPLTLLREAFPELPWLRFPGARIQYPEKGPLLPALARQMPAFLNAARAEGRWVRQLHRQCPLSAIVSDNRYGVRLDGVPSAMLTHQVSIRVPGVPGAGMLVHAAIARMLAPFDALWIPDRPGPDNLSGRLSDRYGIPQQARFVGALTRFGAAPPVPADWKPLLDEGPFEAVLLVSGPDPAADRFRRKLSEQAVLSGRRLLLVEGRPDAEPGWQYEGALLRCAHLPSPVLEAVLASTPRVLCRSGYSTLMDLGVFGSQAMLVPTPGQSEQEYLAQRCTEMGWARTQAQKDLDLEAVFAGGDTTPEMPDFRAPDRLRQALEALLAL
jgi:hypothetical protein